MKHNIYSFSLPSMNDINKHGENNFHCVLNKQTSKLLTLFSERIFSPKSDVDHNGQNNPWHFL